MSSKFSKGVGSSEDICNFGESIFSRDLGERSVDTIFKENMGGEEVEMESVNYSLEAWLKARKKKVTYVDTSIRLTTDFSLKTVEARG